MTKVLSLMMAVYLAVLNLFGVPFSAPDLEENTSTPEYMPTEEDIRLFRGIYESETAWLALIQLDNGAIPMTYTQNGVVKVNPYFSDLSALALLDNAQLYKENVKKYIDWHFNHLNSADEDYNGLEGTIYDYNVTVTDGKATKEEIIVINGKKTYDSTDSYAATFLSVLNKYYEKTGDGDYIISHKDDILKIVNVMCATLHNGLTYATPDHTVKYLMDNCEVYKAFLDTAELFENVFPEDYEKVAEYRKIAEDIKQAVNYELWSFTGAHYVTEVTKHGIPTKIYSWSRYYPCATSQLFPISCGLISPDSQRAKNLYEEFCENYRWEYFEYDDAFYWGANVYAAVVMNDLPRALIYMKNYEGLMETHAYPLYNAEIARVSMAAFLLLERYEK